MDRDGGGRDEDDDDSDDDELVDEVQAMRVVWRHSFEFVQGVHDMHVLHAFFVLWNIFVPEFRRLRFQ